MMLFNIFLGITALTLIVWAYLVRDRSHRFEKDSDLRLFIKFLIDPFLVLMFMALLFTLREGVGQENYLITTLTTIGLHLTAAGIGFFFMLGGFSKFEEPFSILQFAKWTSEAALGITLAFINLLVLGGYIYVGIVATYALAS